MPSAAWAAAAMAAVALVGTAGTEAKWVGTATIPGVTVRTPDVRPPSIACSGLTVSWSAVPGATGYAVLVAGIQVARVTATSYALTLGGLVTVEAEFGPTWVSGPSNQQTCSHL